MSKPFLLTEVQLEGFNLPHFQEHVLFFGFFCYRTDQIDGFVTNAQLSQTQMYCRAYVNYRNFLSIF